jgi:hypothetical protein
MTALENAARSGARDSAIEREALAWIEDPLGHFGMSNTRIHSVPRGEAEAVQLAAMNILLERRRAEIPVLAKLADAQGIARLDTIDDMAPLLFEHNVYKSYPSALLSKLQFGQLTRWLDRLTPCDLSGVDVSRCESIDQWLDTLFAETPLDVGTSSGTSGTMSFFPKTKADYRLCFGGLRVQVLQPFGEAPSDSALHDKFHVMTPLYRDGYGSVGRLGPYCRDIFAHGDDAYFHTAFSFKQSCDLTFLGARLRAAAAKGDVSRVDVPPALLARRDELARMQADMPEQQAAFIRDVVKKLTGERVIAIGISTMFDQVAQWGLSQGVQGVLGPGSRVMSGGGGKGAVLEDGWAERIKAFFGVDTLFSNYGMTELTSLMIGCEQGNYHLPPWLVLFVLDPETGQPKPRSGTQTGRASFFDISHDGTWGGVVTGDKVTAHWDADCPCGRASVYLEGNVQRFSEISGGDDKITCAATSSAQNEALDYLNAF